MERNEHHLDVVLEHGDLEHGDVEHGHVRLEHVIVGHHQFGHDQLGHDLVRFELELEQRIDQLELRLGLERIRHHLARHDVGLTMTAAHEWALWSTDARLVVTRDDALPMAIEVAQRELAIIAAAVDRFDATSELNRISDRLPDGVRVSATLADFVRAALKAAELTGGLVDPTVRTAMDALGYDRDIRLILDDDRPIRVVVRHTPGWRRITLDGDLLTVPAHLSLDLGATAKALAADRVAAAVAVAYDCGVLLSLGGDIACAGPEPVGGWQVTVQDAAGEPIDQVTLRAGAGIATSSLLHRRWQRAGRDIHHIVDPRTGEPAPEVWRTVTVAARSCVEANALSTAAIIRGTEAPAWLADVAPARLVSAVGDVVTTGGWPAPTRLAA